MRYLVDHTAVLPADQSSGCPLCLQLSSVADDIRCLQVDSATVTGMSVPGLQITYVGFPVNNCVIETELVSTLLQCDGKEFANIRAKQL